LGKLYRALFYVGAKHQRIIPDFLDPVYVTDVLTLRCKIRKKGVILAVMRIVTVHL